VSSRPCHQPMTIDDEALKRAYNEGKTIKQLAEMFGYSGSALGARALKLGCKRRLFDSTRLPIRSILMAYTEHNMTRTAIAKKVGCAATTIGRVLRQHGILPKRGIRAPDLVEHCVRLVRSGLSCVEAGKRLGLSRAQVNRRVRPVLGKLPHYPPPCAPTSELIRLHAEGKSYREIGKIYNRHHETIRIRIHRFQKAQQRANELHA